MGLVRGATILPMATTPPMDRAGAAARGGPTSARNGAVRAGRARDRATRSRSSARARHRRRWPSSAGAALRSALVPGWGQSAAGYSRRGVLLLLAALAIASVPLAIGVALVRPFAPLLRQPLLDRVLDASAGTSAYGDALLRVLTAPGLGDWAVLWRAFIAANVVLALLRAFVALDAAALASRRAAGDPPGRHGMASRLHSPVAGAAAISAALVVVAPHAALGWLGFQVRPMLAQILVPQARPAPDVTPVPEVKQAVSEADSGRPVWDGTNRLNVLLLGTDRRPVEAAVRPWGNSDTILVVSIDPGLQGGAMISVPRDLFLPIPGVGQEKINAAYREGGPPLALKVVSDLLGQPIHRWASIDTAAFAKMIDAVGGVVVDVERPIRDDEYPTEDYAIRRILIPAGLQWLDGERALWYARSRHGSDDFDRGYRQQRLMLSLKERLRAPGTISRLPVLMNTLADAVQTDITPREALAVARLGSQRDLGTVRSLVLQPPDYGRVINRPDLYAIDPNLPRIRKDVSDLLGPGAPGAPLAVPRTVRELPEVPIDVIGQGGAADDTPPDPDDLP